MNTGRSLAAAKENAPVSLFLTPQVPRMTSTPRQSAQKKKAPRKFVRPVCDTCEKCGKEYRCHRSYMNHVRGHKIVDLASRYPQTEEIKRHLAVNCVKVFEDLKQKGAFGKKGRDYKEFMSSLIRMFPTFNSLQEWETFTDVVHSSITCGFGSSKFLLPTALIADLQKNAESLLSNIDERNSLCTYFQVCCPCDEGMFQYFLADYVLHLVMDIVKFISASIRPDTVSLPVSADDASTVLEAAHIEYLETIHYIAGSKIRAFYNKSLGNPKVSIWKNIGRVISERLLESDVIPGPPNNVKGWTAAQNRGRLFFVSGTVFDFFCGVADVLEKQPSKLRVSCEDAIEKVCENGIVLLWDEAVGDSMSESESFNFMCGVIRAFSQTFAIGKAKRIINSTRKKAEASVSLRNRLAK